MVFYFGAVSETDAQKYRELMNELASIDPIFESIWSKLTHQGTTDEQVARVYQQQLADRCLDHGQDWLADFVRNRMSVSNTEALKARRQV